MPLSVSTECFLNVMERPPTTNDHVNSSSALATDNVQMARQCYLSPEQRVEFYRNQEQQLRNQEAPPQPTTDYITQALQQPSYSGIASTNIPQPRILPILKLKIIPPFNKDHFATKTTFEQASNQCIAAILRQFPVQLRTKLTLSKTFTMVGTRRLHTFHLVAPPEASDVFTRLQSTGIEMLGRTVIPQSDSFQRILPGIYPKHVPVRMLQLPSLCTDQEINELLDLPDSTSITSVRHHTDEIDGMNFYTGRASAMIRITSKEHEEQLRQWSITTHEHGTLQWNDIPIYAFIPALHQCNHCKDHRRPFHGHDIAWCRHAKAEEQQRLMTATTDNQAPSIPPPPTDNQATISDTHVPETTTPTVDATNEMTETPDETTDSNQDNQEDTETTSEDDDDSQPWQTAPTHSTKTLSVTKTQAATKTQSQPCPTNTTKRKAHNKARLFATQNLQMPAPKKKKKPTK